MTLARLNSTFSGKLRTYVTFPEISIANTWRGASEIIAKYNFTLDKRFSITELFSSAPFGVNFIACISWKPTEETIVRYRLWKDLGEILYVEDYDGQRINGDFAIEIWNTPDTLIKGGPFSLRLSTLVLPSDFCEDDDIELGTDYRTCTDLIFNFNTFKPIDGDYYVVISDCGVTQLIKNTLTADYVLIRADDGNWRKLELIVVDGVVYSQTSSTDLTSTLTYVPIIDRFSGLGFQMNCTVITEGGVTSYYPYIGTFVDAGVEAYGALYLKANDNNYYGVRVILEDWHSYPLYFPPEEVTTGTYRIEIDQTPL